jgi:hypothetical protein
LAGQTDCGIPARENQFLVVEKFLGEKLSTIRSGGKYE